MKRPKRSLTKNIGDVLYDFMKLIYTHIKPQILKILKINMK